MRKAESAFIRCVHELHKIPKPDVRKTQESRGELAQEANRFEHNIILSYYYKISEEGRNMDFKLGTARRKL